MNRMISSALSIAAAVGMSASAHAQGTITFSEAGLTPGYRPTCWQNSTSIPKGTELSNQFFSSGVLMAATHGVIAYVTNTGFEGWTGSPGPTGNFCGIVTCGTPYNGSIDFSFVDPCGRAATVSGSTISFTVEDSDTPLTNRVTAKSCALDGSLIETVHLTNTDAATLSFTTGTVARVEITDNGPDGFLLDTFSYGAIAEQGCPCVSEVALVTCPTDTANFSVMTAGTASQTFQWRKNSINLSNGATGSGSTISGATTATLQVDTTSSSDDGVYDCIISASGCGTISSDGITYSHAGVPPCCNADFNGDGNVDQDDIAALISVVGGGVCP